MYAAINFKTKKAFKEAVAKSIDGTGPKVEVFHPGIQGRTSGVVCIEGPHYPQAHSWYATATIENMVVVGKVK